MKSFINSGFWSQRSSSLYLQESLVALLVDASFRSRLLITLLKGIDDYFAAISPQPPFYTLTRSSGECADQRSVPEVLDIPEEGTNKSTGESTISISIKKKVRGKITL